LDPRPWTSAAVIVIALRLGLTHINDEYIPVLMDVLRLPQCVGCIGGRPNHSLYIVGTRGTDEVVYLDPHTTQSMNAAPPPLPVHSEDRIDSVDNATNSASTAACSSTEASVTLPSLSAAIKASREWGDVNAAFIASLYPRKPLFMSASALDPSLAIGFHAPTHQHLLELCEQLQVITRMHDGLSLFDVDVSGVVPVGTGSAAASVATTGSVDSDWRSESTGCAGARIDSADGSVDAAACAAGGNGDDTAAGSDADDDFVLL
jgi:hypothetical protein